MAKHQDMGPVAFVVAADPVKQQVIFSFNKAISRVELSPEQAMEVAANLMGRAAVASGKTVAEMVQARAEQNASAQRP